MAFEFSETFTLEIPNVEAQLGNFSEADYKDNHGLIIEVAAIHEGLTGNFNHYSSDALNESLKRWTEPYPKPILLNHDPKSEALGRVIGATMAQEEDGTPYVKLQVAITDPAAMQKVADGRYLTGSVGGKANEAFCSVCNTDWANAKEGIGMPCKHRRGRAYGGKLAFMDMRKIEWKEYSFVNVPGDQRSQIRSVGAHEAELVTTPKFYLLDMTQESILECNESESHDVLEGLRKKDAAPLYHSLKGGFLSALALEEAETQEADELHKQDVEEISMADEAKELTEEQEDDILAVTEELSDDLSAASEEEPAEEEEATEEEVVSEEEDTEPTEEAAGEHPQGQEKPSEKDVDPDNSDGAPISREDETTEEEEAKLEEQADETELTQEQDDSTELLVEELKSRVEALEEENTRLRKALHRTLAERVVDAKINVGILEVAFRKDSIEEHAQRTASSLADTLRDLSSMPQKPVKSPDVDKLKIDEASQVVGDEKQVVTIGEEEDSDSSDDPLANLEEKLVDRLMGRARW